MRPGTRWATALMLSASVALTACGGAAGKSSTGTAPDGSSGKGKQLVLGIWSAPHNFEPITNDTTYGQLVYNLIYPSLVDMTPQLDFEGRLAEKWDVSPDKTTFTFHLHKDAKWSDGHPITADDVKYFFDTIANPDTPTTRRADIATLAGLDKEGKAPGGISGIKVIDPNTVEFTNQKPVDPGAFLEKVAAKHFEPKSVLETVKDKKTLDKADFVTAPKVDGGPFHFVKYETDQHVELAANKGYFLGAPKLDKVFIKIASQATMLAGAEKGEIDVTAGAGIGEIPVTDWDKAGKLTNATQVTFPNTGWQYMDINSSRPELNDKRVRQALAYAINRKLMVTRLLKGQGEVMNTPLTSVNKYYRNDLTDKYPYDPEKAKALLKEANFDLSKPIELIVPTGNVVREQSGDIILQNLKDVGLNVSISKADFPTMQGRARKGDYQLRLVGFTSTFDPDFAGQFGTGGGFNYGKYSNPAMDVVLTQGNALSKFDDRKKQYDKAQDIFVEDLPVLPLYAPFALEVVNKRVTGAKPCPNFITWNAHLWDVQ